MYPHVQVDNLNMILASGFPSRVFLSNPSAWFQLVMAKRDGEMYKTFKTVRRCVWTIL